MSNASGPFDNVRGVVVHQLGDWRNAGIGTLPLKAPGTAELLIATEACSLNFQDLLLIDGKYQYQPPLPFFAGRDVAGKIVAMGPGANDFSVGDRVSAQVSHGAFARLVLAPADRCFRISQSIDASKAAAAGTTFATAAVALTMRAQMRAGERVLVTGAAGGVGTAAIQYAKYLGAEIVALVSSSAKADAVRALGVKQIIQIDAISDSTALRERFSALGIELVDVVLDVVGGGVFDAAIRCLRPGGRFIVVGFASGRIPVLKANYPLLKEIAVIGSSLENVLNRRDPVLHELMETIYREIAGGRFHPLITATYSFSEFHEAAKEIAGRGVIGKIVLLP